MSKIKILRLFLKIKELLNLKHDFDEEGCAESIKANVDFKSGNAWSLIFAIFIASIGLQTNSVAIIIGAMLISPLMGPIVGAGFSLGTHDFELLKKSLSNIFYAVFISIATSTVFFTISPSAILQSELIARTQPTFFDVMIAFFGGAAGIVATSRKSKGNAIPGVAIATALMPPLCTVGYGLAHFKISFVVGALYLFTINATFIFAATYLFVRFLNFKILVDRDPIRDKKIHKWMSVGAVIIILPSIVMAWYLQKKTTFEGLGNSFIENEINFPNTLVAQKKFSFSLKKSAILISTIGKDITEQDIDRLQKKLSENYGLDNVNLVIKPLRTDALKLSELEDKFVTKADLFKQRAQEQEALTKNKVAKLQMVNSKLKKFFPHNFIDIQLIDNQVLVNWRREINLKDQQKAESLIEKYFKDDFPPIIHKY